MWLLLGSLVSSITRVYLCRSCIHIGYISAPSLFSRYSTPVSSNLGCGSCVERPCQPVPCSLCAAGLPPVRASLISPVSSVINGALVVMCSSVLNFKYHALIGLSLALYTCIQTEFVISGIGKLKSQSSKSASPTTWVLPEYSNSKVP